MRSGGHLGYVGVFHDEELPVMDLFVAGITLQGGHRTGPLVPARAHRLIWNRRIDPGRVFDLELPLDQAAAGYAAKHTR
jgi:threonine dehydrogenase-like Zn-dependent dehydrogenase